MPQREITWTFKEPKPGRLVAKATMGCRWCGTPITAEGAVPARNQVHPVSRVLARNVEAHQKRCGERPR